MMKDRTEGIKLASGLLLLLIGVVMGRMLLMTKDGLAQNHYLYVTSYMDHAVLVPTYLPIYAGICILPGAYLLSKIKRPAVRDFSY